MESMESMEWWDKISLIAAIATLLQITFSIAFWMHSKVKGIPVSILIRAFGRGFFQIFISIQVATAGGIYFGYSGIRLEDVVWKFGLFSTFLLLLLGYAIFSITPKGKPIYIEQQTKGMKPEALERFKKYSNVFVTFDFFSMILAFLASAAMVLFATAVVYAVHSS